MSRSQNVSHLIDGLDRAVLSHLCPGKTSISYTERWWDTSQYRVSSVPSEGRDIESPYKGVPVSHLTYRRGALAETCSPSYRSQCLCDHETVLDRKVQP